MPKMMMIGPIFPMMSIIRLSPMGLQPRRVNSLLKRSLAQKGIRYVRKKTEYTTSENLPDRKIPTKRIAARAGILEYYNAAVAEGVEYEPTRLILALKQGIGKPVGYSPGNRHWGEIICRAD